MLAVFLLAIVQGLTEFLPVSSSGHLVLFGHLLGTSDQGLTLDIVLHGGTLAILLIYYRKTLVSLLTRTLRDHPEREEMLDLLLSLSLATAITAGLGLGFKDWLESLFESPPVAASCLLVTGLFLLSRHGRKDPDGTRIGWKNAALIGLVQSFAILPGISRSGSTIVAALWLGLAPAVAARFSFLLAIPAIGGALLLELPDISGAAGPSSGKLALGFIVAAAASWVGLRLVLNFVERGRLSLFGFYCLAVGLIALVLLGVGS